MKIQEIEEFAEKNSTARDWIHTRQIRPIAAELAAKEGANKEIVDVAVLFHDVGKSKNEKDHAVESEKFAREFLESKNHDKDFIQKVCDAIRRHSGPFTGGEMPQTIEDKVVFDADMIQQMGPLGIAKNFDYAKNINDFAERLKKARDMLMEAAALVMTETGKEMIKEGIEYCEKFFEEALK